MGLILLFVSGPFQLLTWLLQRLLVSIWALPAFITKLALDQWLVPGLQLLKWLLLQGLQAALLALTSFLKVVSGPCQFLLQRLLVSVWALPRLLLLVLERLSLSGVQVFKLLLQQGPQAALVALTSGLKIISGPCQFLLQWLLVSIRALPGLIRLVLEQLLVPGVQVFKSLLQQGHQAALVPVTDGLKMVSGPCEVLMQRLLVSVWALPRLLLLVLERLLLSGVQVFKLLLQQGLQASLLALTSGLKAMEWVLPYVWYAALGVVLVAATIMVGPRLCVLLLQLVLVTASMTVKLVVKGCGCVVKGAMVTAHMSALLGKAAAAMAISLGKAAVCTIHLLGKATWLSLKTCVLSVECFLEASRLFQLLWKIVPKALTVVCKVCAKSTRAAAGMLHRVIVHIGTSYSDVLTSMRLFCKSIAAATFIPKLMLLGGARVSSFVVGRLKAVVDTAVMILWPLDHAEVWLLCGAVVINIWHTADMSDLAQLNNHWGAEGAALLAAAAKGFMWRFVAMRGYFIAARICLGLLVKMCVMIYNAINGGKRSKREASRKVASKRVSASAILSKAAGGTEEAGNLQHCRDMLDAGAAHDAFPAVGVETRAMARAKQRR